MSDDRKAREEEVFGQDLSMDDLDAAAGGRRKNEYRDNQGNICYAPAGVDPDPGNCSMINRRQIYGGGGFPNCAATVGDGSWCGTNDACNKNAVEYYGKKDCGKAWR